MVQDKESLSSRLGDVVGEKGHDAEQGKAAILQFLGQELRLYFRSLVDGAAAQ